MFAANAVCCFPNRTPEGGEIYACRGNLYAQVQLCRPRFILALGRTANWTFGKEDPMSKLHGRWYGMGWLMQWPMIEVLPTYHPAAVLRNKALTRVWREDLASFVSAVFK